MSVTTVRDRLAAIQMTVSGMAASYARQPVPLPQTLPAVVNSVGPATYTVAGNGATHVTRTYTMTLFSTSIAAGLTAGMESTAETIMINLITAFLRRPNLGRLSGVLHAEIITDAGIGEVTYLGEPYLGAQIEILVEETQVVTPTESV